jgi:hypothetical protein
MKKVIRGGKEIEIEDGSNDSIRLFERRYGKVEEEKGIIRLIGSCFDVEEVEKLGIGEEFMFCYKEGIIVDLEKVWRSKFKVFNRMVSFEDFCKSKKIVGLWFSFSISKEEFLVIKKREGWFNSLNKESWDRSNGFVEESEKRGVRMKKNRDDWESNDVVGWK